MQGGSAPHQLAHTTRVWAAGIETSGAGGNQLTARADSCMTCRFRLSFGNGPAAIKGDFANSIKSGFGIGFATIGDDDVIGH
jgi:hypothetical protein